MVEVLSLVAGVVIGAFLVLVVLESGRHRHRHREIEMARDMMLLGRWLVNAYRLMSSLKRPSRKEDKPRGAVEDDYEELIRYLLDRSLIVRVMTNNGDEYKLTAEGEDLCGFIEEVSRKAGCKFS